jgi:hypothetical protein
MQRRNFLTASLAASALALARKANSQSAAAAQSTPAAQPSATPPEYYQIRRYQLHSGPQTALTQAYFAGALIPALTRLGLGPIGAFQADFSTQSPAYYLLIPAASVEALAQLTLRLAADPAFLKAADPFWNAPASAPSFDRVETSLLQAFSGWPRLTPPPAAASSKRIFQMRTYESPSEQAHIRKVEMFNSGEFACFIAAGFHPVFFADTLIGSRMPCLTYMLSLSSLDEYNARWDAFRNHPDWKKLSSNPRYNVSVRSSPLNLTEVSSLEVSTYF